LSEALQPITFNLGIIDLADVPRWNYLWTADWSGFWLPGLLLFFIPLVSGGAQFISTMIIRKTTPTPPTTEGAGKSMQTMMMLMPLISVYFGYILPGALGFYWTVGTVLQVGQDIWLTKRYTKILDAEDEVRNRQRKAKEAEIEAKRLESERRKAEGVIEKNPNISKRKKQKSEKQEQIEKAAEYEKKIAPVEEEDKNEPGRIGNRRYARGRANDPERYKRVSKKKKKGSKEELEDTEIAPEEEVDENSEFGIRNSELEGDKNEDEEDNLNDEDDGDDEVEDDDDGDEDEEEEDEEEDDEEDDDDDIGDDDEDDGDEGGETPPDARFDTARFDEDKKD